MKIDHRLETILTIIPEDRSEDQRSYLIAEGEDMAVSFRGSVESFLGDIKELGHSDLLDAYHRMHDMAGDFDLDEHIAVGFAWWNNLRACEADITPILASVIKRDKARTAQLVRDRRARLNAEAPLTPLMEACGEVE